MTFMFLMIILGATDSRAPKGFAGIAIGLGLTLIHLISIPVTNTSVNPARSTSQAIFVGDWAIGQLWLFWVAPILGAVLAGLVYKWLGSPEKGESSKSYFSITVFRYLVIPFFCGLLHDHEKNYLLSRRGYAIPKRECALWPE